MKLGVSKEPKGLLQKLGHCFLIYVSWSKKKKSKNPTAFIGGAHGRP